MLKKLTQLLIVFSLLFSSFFSINLYLNQNKLFYTLDSCKIDHHQSFSVFITIIIVTILNLVMILIIIILITTLDNKFDDDKNKSNNQYYWFSMAIVCLCMFECVCIADLIFSSYSIAYDFWLSFFFSNNHFRLLIIDIFVDLYLLIHAKLDNDFFLPLPISFFHGQSSTIIIITILLSLVFWIGLLFSLFVGILNPFCLHCLDHNCSQHTHTHTRAHTPNQKLLSDLLFIHCCQSSIFFFPSHHFLFHTTIFDHSFI